MTYKTLPLVIASALYLWQAANYAIAGDKGMTLAFLAYSVSNWGFIWATSE